MNLARCRRCRQVILWVDSATTGRPVPLDAAPAADGNVTLGQAGATFLSPEQAETGRMLGTQRYKVHLCNNDVKPREIAGNPPRARHNAPVIRH